MGKSSGDPRVAMASKALIGATKVAKKAANVEKKTVVAETVLADAIVESSAMAHTTKVKDGSLQEMLLGQGIKGLKKVTKGKNIGRTLVPMNDLKMALGGKNVRATGRVPVPVTGTELIFLVPGTTGFGITAIPLNPGLTNGNCFLELSRIAAIYSRYVAISMLVQYKTLSTEFTEKGRVLAYFDFDPYEAPAPSWAAAENTAPSVSCATADKKGFNLMLSGQDLMGGRVLKYVRNGFVNTPGDIREYDLGTLYICTDACTDTANVGEIHITYKVYFHDINPNSLAYPLVNKTITVYSYTSAGSALTTATPEYCNAANAAGGTFTFNALSLSFSTNSISLPLGNYVIFASFVLFGAAGTLITSAGAVFSSASSSPGSTTSYNANANLTVSAGGAFPLSFVAYVSSNGLATITVYTQATFTVSTASVQGQMIIQCT